LLHRGFHLDEKPSQFFGPDVLFLLFLVGAFAQVMDVTGSMRAACIMTGGSEIVMDTRAGEPLHESNGLKSLTAAFVLDCIMGHVLG
jgi:hypothetical protein